MNKGRNTSIQAPPYKITHARVGLAEIRFTSGRIHFQFVFKLPTGNGHTAALTEAMQVLRETSWQWTPKAAITAADACHACTALALEYVDCALLHVRFNPRATSQSRRRKSVEEPQLDGDAAAIAPMQDLELAGHSERITSVCAFKGSTSANVSLCSASSDWCVCVAADVSILTISLLLTEPL